MNQTRFYAVEDRKRAVRVCLLVGGLPPLLSTEQYVQLLQEHLAIKSKPELMSPDCSPPAPYLKPSAVSAGHLVAVSHTYTSQGELVAVVTKLCTSEMY